jgi:hypothetical protein
MSASSIPVAVGNPEEYQFATFIADRQPQFKIHRTVGLAHGAITYRTRSRNYTLVMTSDCALYRRVGQEWRVVYSFNCNMELRCLPWQKDPGAPEQRLADDALRSIKISVADLRRRAAHYALDPVLAEGIEKECQAFTARIEELFA